MFLSGRVSSEQRKHEQELEDLRGKAVEQEKQLRDVNLKAAELIEKQSQMAQNLIEQQNQLQIAQQAAPQIPAQPIPAQEVAYQGSQEPLNETISELSSDIEDIDEDEMIDKVMSWIEK